MSAAPDDVAPFSGLTKAEKIFTVTGSLLGMLLAAIDQTVVATAGPEIQKSLHIDPSLYVWITTSYMVASTVLVPIYGKLSDQLGRRRVLLAAIAIFLVGSVLCGLSQNTWQLIGFRALQGMGSAGLFTSAFAVIADIFPPRERGKYQGTFGAVFGLSSVIGPLLGGFITDTFGWHWVFFVNIPIGAIAVTFIVLRMPALRLPSREGGSVDWVGALMLTLGVAPLLVALSLGKGEADPRPNLFPWLSWQIGSLLGVAVIGCLLFVLVERRAVNPIVDLKLFSIRPFRFTIVTTFIVGGSFLAAIVFLPLFMVNVVGLSATRSGLTTMPLTFGLIFANVMVGRLVSRIGRYKFLLVGSLVILCGAFAVMGWTLTPESSQLEVTLKMILVGIGLGPSLPLFTLASQSAVPPRQIGVATSTATFSRQMGTTVGIAVIGTIFAGALSTRIGEEMAPVLAKVPPEFRSRFGPGSAGGAGEEAAPMGTFDAAKVKDRIHAQFAEQRKIIEALPAEDPRHNALPAIAKTEAAAIETTDAVAASIKRAFTDAIRHVYRAALVIAVIGLLLALISPEVPLKGRGPGTPAPAPAE